MLKDALLDALTILQPTTLALISKELEDFINDTSEEAQNVGVSPEVVKTQHNAIIFRAFVGEAVAEGKSLETSDAQS